MATYQSSQTTAFGAGTSCVITKPTSLAAGDLLVAHLFSSNSPTPPSFTVPAGWTEQINTVSSGSTDTDCRLQVFTKVADSSDAAASNFTFTVTTTTYAGGLSRVTNFGKVSGSSSGIQNDSNSTPVTISGFTPDRADNLLMIFTCASGASGSGTYPSFSGYSIATSNPTWTERYDQNYSPNDRFGMAMATASRPESTATGNVSVALSASSTADTVIAILGIAPALSATSTPDPISTTTRVDNALSPVDPVVTVMTPSSTTIRETTWVNESVATTEWTNEQY